MRRICVLISIVCVLVCHNSLFALDKDEELAFRRNIAEGAAFLAQGKKPQAMGRFKAAKKIHPESPQVFYWLGLTWSDLQDFRAAMEHAKKAVILSDERMPEAWLLWGQSLLYLRRWENARQKLEKAFRLAPEDPLVAFALGRCYFHGFDDKHTALKFFKKALDLDPKFTAARLYAGICFRVLDIPAPAINAFKQVLEWEPDNYDAKFRLAFAYRIAGRFAEAEKTFQELLRQTPSAGKEYMVAEVHLQLGHLYLTDIMDSKQAQSHLRKFIRLAPNHKWTEKVMAYLASEERTKNGDPLPPPPPVPLYD